MEQKSVLEIFKASRPVVKGVDISTGTVFVKSLTAAQHQMIVRHNRDNPENAFSDMALVCLTLCEPDGRSVFANHEEGLEFAKLASQADISTLADAVLRLSGIRANKGPEETEKKG